MKHPRLWTALALFALLAVVGSMALSRAGDAGDRGFSSGSYLITNKDSGGNFFSRGVITLHADHTVSITDSAQGGPLYFFSSQLGSWKQDASGRILVKTIDFDYPPNADVARLEFIFVLSRDGTQIRGTEIITLHPLDDEHALEDEGTFFGSFTITGELIKP